MRKNVGLLLTFIFVLMFNSYGKSTKWEMACQAYTFKEFTLSEALDEMEKLGIKYVELFSAQKMLPNDNRNTHFSMPEQQIKELKALLKKHGIKATSYGVITPEGKAEWIALMEFAKTMGIKTIASEPTIDQMAMIDELCQHYKIKVAIHNHPAPGIYWNPETTKKALEGRSAYMGVCADFGHWTRSGHDVTECLKILEGHIIEIHMKDVNKTDKSGHSVVWGEGVINWERVFKELKRQNFSGKFVIEHEYNWNNPVPDLKKNLIFFSLNTK